MKTSADFGNDFHYIFSLFEETIRCQKAPHKMQCSSLRSISDVLTRNAHKVSRAFGMNLQSQREEIDMSKMQIRKTAHRTLTIPQTKPIGLLQKCLRFENTYDKTTSKTMPVRAAMTKLP